MSAESTLQKKGIDMLVDTNPTSITISRTTLTNKDGAMEEAVTSIGPFNIALFNGPPRGLSKAIRISLDGLRTDRLDWCALAKSDADIKGGANDRDVFDVEGLGRFQVHTVFPIVTHGVTTGKFMYLEMFS
jgi:hypothetical protein